MSGIWGSYGVPMGHYGAPMGPLWGSYGSALGHSGVMGLLWGRYGSLWGSYGAAMGQVDPPSPFPPPQSHPGTNVSVLDLFDRGQSLRPLWVQVEGFRRAVEPIMANAAGGVHLICYSQGMGGSWRGLGGIWGGLGGFRGDMGGIWGS